MMENHNHREKEKQKITGHYSDGGDFMEKRSGKHSKSRHKREVDQDRVRASKKFKEAASHFLVEDGHSNLDMAYKPALIMDNGLSTTVNEKVLLNCSDQSSLKDSKCETKGNLSVSIRRSKDSSHVLQNGEFEERSNALVVEKSGTFDFSAKKRKSKEWQESKGHQDNVMSSQHVLESRLTAKEAFSESELRKQNKAKVPASAGRGLTITDTDDKMDKKGRFKILLSGRRECPHGRVDEEKRVASGKEKMEHYHGNAPSRRALNDADSMKIYAQLPAAATSTSSKVSGSHKSKANTQEVKGSPVASVSSCPLRVHKKVSTESYSLVKDDVLDVGFSFMGSPKRCSDGEVDCGSDQSGTQRKKTGFSGRLRSFEGGRASESGVLGSSRETCIYQDKQADHLSGGKAKEEQYLKRCRQVDTSSTEFEETRMVYDTGMDQSNNCNSEGLEKDDFHNRDKLHNQQHANGSSQRKLDKSSYLSSRERNKSSNADADRIKLKVNDSVVSKKDLYSFMSVSNYQSEVDYNCDDNSTYQEDPRDENYKFQEKDEDYLGKKNSSAKRSHANRRGSFSNKETEDNLDARSKDFNSKATLAGSSCKSNFQENLLLAPSHPSEKPNDIPDRIDQLKMTSGRGILQSVQPSKDKHEAQSWAPQTGPTPKRSRSELYPVYAVNKQRKPDNQNGKHALSLKQATPSNHDWASPMRKNGPASAHVLKEARDLKHTANHLKKEGLEHESIGIYFESALKFLDYASLLEPSTADSAKQGELKHMMHMYSETAQLCLYCAHEYVRCKEMAAAALAYKCVEVAYMKAAYYKHPGASKDQHELQTAFQTAQQGESPSSSASDVDNLNIQGALDKAASTKAMQIAGNYVIAAHNRLHFMGLLSYTNDLICAFEATKRSQSAIALAGVTLDKVKSEGLSSLRKVLDFNYHNIEGLLRLVRLSMASIGR